MNNNLYFSYRDIKSLSFKDFILSWIGLEITIISAIYIFLLVYALVSPHPPPGPIISPILISLLLSSLFLVYLLLIMDSANKSEDRGNAKKLFIISRLFFLFVMLYYPVMEGVYFLRIENFIVIPFIYIYGYIIGVFAKKYKKYND